MIEIDDVRQLLPPRRAPEIIAAAERAAMRVLLEKRFISADGGVATREQQPDSSNIRLQILEAGLHGLAVSYYDQSPLVEASRRSLDAVVLPDGNRGVEMQIDVERKLMAAVLAGILINELSRLGLAAQNTDGENMN